jgi:2-keto-4-pentenoate hydratase
MNIEAAAQFILGHWRAGTRCAAFPVDLRPATKPDAYRIQALVEQQSAKPLFGWKIAATSVAGQKHIGVAGPLAGRYIAERCVTSGTTIPFGRNHMKVAEVEFAFRLGSDITQRNHPYTDEEVFAAVASLHPAIEIPDSRFDQFETVGEAQLIADNACAHWLAIGEACPDTWRDLDLAAYEPVGRVSHKPEVKGRGSNVLGSPRLAMVWFVNEMTSLGVTLKRGQTVTTGTCLSPMAVAAGDTITGGFGKLGHIHVKLGP